MYTKSKQRTLIILFVILAIIVAVLKFLDYQKGDRTFRSDILKIDTSAVSAIHIFPKSANFKDVKFYRNGRIWTVMFNNKSWSCEPGIMKSVLSQIAEMKAERIATTEKSKWKELGVSQDEGLRVKIDVNNKADADFVIGKISYSQSPNPYYQRGSMNTYIRLLNSGDDKVYAVSGYLGMMLNRDVNSFRNGMISNINRDNIQKITFRYPGDSSFVMTKQGRSWMVDNLSADSAGAANYLNTVSQIMSNEFADDFDINHKSPVCSVMIESDKNTAEIKAFPADAEMKYVLTSSQNPDAKFRGDRNELFKRVFVGKQKLSHK
jgi:hypothetical protein